MIPYQQFLKESLTLQYHDTLNPRIWMENGYLRENVKDDLLKIAQEWIGFTYIDKFEVEVKDIILTGGNANYNYTDVSDLDVHVIIDFKEFVGKMLAGEHLNKATNSVGFVEDYMKTKKALWSAKHHIHVYGYPVELYTQPSTEKYHTGQGVYSLLKNDWVITPNHEHLNFSDNPHIEKKVEYFEHEIKTIVDNNMFEAGQKLKDKFKTMRSAAIHKAGEFAYENLVFKELRNRGALDKLSTYLSQYKDSKLSI